MGPAIANLEAIPTLRRSQRSLSVGLNQKVQRRVQMTQWLCGLCWGNLVAARRDLVFSRLGKMSCLKSCGKTGKISKDCTSWTKTGLNLRPVINTGLVLKVCFCSMCYVKWVPSHFQKKTAMAPMSLTQVFDQIRVELESGLAKWVFLRQPVCLKGWKSLVGIGCWFAFCSIFANGFHEFLQTDFICLQCSFPGPNRNFIEVQVFF